MSKVQFFYNSVRFSFRERNRLKAFVASLFKLEKCPLESISYIFVDDEFLIEMNKTQLNHDYYTDIITFCLSKPNEPIIGEAYISIDRIRENANKLNNRFTHELHRVVFHGSLHLCGYKDKTKTDKETMTLAEDKYLSKYFK